MIQRLPNTILIGTVPPGAEYPWHHGNSWKALQALRDRRARQLRSETGLQVSSSSDTAAMRADDAVLAAGGEPAVLHVRDVPEEAVQRRRKSGSEVTGVLNGPLVLHVEAVLFTPGVGVEVFARWSGAGGRAAQYRDEGFVGRFWGAAGAGILFQAASTGRYLLLLRSGAVEEPHTWGIPGGAVPRDDAGQLMDAWTSARREVREETRFNVPARVKPQARFVWHAPNSDFSFTTFVLLVADEFGPELNWESEDFEWLSREQALDNPDLHPGVRWVLEQMDGGQDTEVESPGRPAGQAVAKRQIRSCPPLVFPPKVRLSRGSAKAGVETKTSAWSGRRLWLSGQLYHPGEVFHLSELPRRTPVAPRVTLCARPPRVPIADEDGFIPRVSWAPSIGAAFLASAFVGLGAKRGAVYTLAEPTYLFQPTEELVPDVHHTHERWALDHVAVQLVEVLDQRAVARLLNLNRKARAAGWIVDSWTALPQRVAVLDAWLDAGRKRR